MGACLNGIVCIRSAREETHSCGVFCSLIAARVGFRHGLHFGFCIYIHHTRFGSGTALLYTSDRHLTQIHPVLSVDSDKACVPSHNLKKSRL